MLKVMKLSVLLVSTFSIGGISAQRIAGGAVVPLLTLLSTSPTSAAMLGFTSLCGLSP